MARAPRITSSSKAHLILSRRPLRFGDPEQVGAMKYLQNLNSAYGLLASCKHARCCFCEGSGMEPCGCQVCDSCGGSGTGDDCRCFRGLSGFAVVEARKTIARVERRV